MHVTLGTQMSQRPGESKNARGGAAAAAAPPSDSGSPDAGGRSPGPSWEVVVQGGWVQ